MKSNRLDNEGRGQAALQRASFLDCGPEDLGDRRAVHSVELTIARRNGEIEVVSLSTDDGHRLLARLAFVLRPDRRPPRVPYGSRQWLSRRSVLRAEAAVQSDRDLQRASQRHRVELPDVSAFVDEQLRSLERALKQTGTSSAKPKTVLRRVTRFATTLVEALRLDR